MAISTISSRELNQDVSMAKRASLLGPVFITDRGEVAHVLLSMEAYLELTRTQASIIDLLAMPTTEEVDFDIPKLSSELYQPENFA